MANHNDYIHFLSSTIVCNDGTMVNYSSIKFVITFVVLLWKYKKHTTSPISKQKHM